MNWKKILLTIVLGGIVVFGAYFAYMILTTKSHSPFEVVNYSGENLEIQVEYCRPFKKERLLFGTAEEGALVPYGKYWRTGANEATEIYFSKPVYFLGAPLDSGKYVLYSIPGASEWTIGLNTQLGRWGASEVDHNKDVLQAKATAEMNANRLEQFTIDINEQEEGVAVNLKWDNMVVPILIAPQ